MCGIVGVISKHGSFPYHADDLFTNMLRMDSIRGDDSTGVFGVTKDGHCDIVKGDADGYLFTRTQNYNDFISRMSNQYRIVIGHNRAATTGSISAANAHPFQERHITLVHNGTIHNKDSLKKETEVDSHAICHALADHDPVQALGKIDGAYALVWWDESDKSINLARNSQRPLVLLEYDTLYIISSEPGLPVWLNSRENRKPIKVEMVPTEKILAMKLNSISKGFFEVPYEEYKYWTQQQNKTSHIGEYPIIGPTHTRKPTVPFDGSSNVVDLTAHSKTKENDLLKAGSRIIFKLEDSRPEEGTEILIGHPVFDNEVDPNVFVRCVLPRDTTQEQLLKYFDHEYYVGEIQYFRTMNGVPVVFMKTFTPHILVEDSSGNVSTEIELTEAVKSGCGKCKRGLTVEEAKKGIARKKKDNTWRLVCPECLEISVKAVQESKPGITLRTRVN